MKQLLPVIMLAFCMFTTLGSCKKHSDDTSVQVITVGMKANETYTLDLKESFEEEHGCFISQQAQHFTKSEISAVPGEVRIYTYVPEVNYTGSDEVVIESFGTGFGGDTGVTYKKIVFTIGN